ncbi:MAG: dihydroorotase [Bacillota bacterium]
MKLLLKNGRVVDPANNLDAVLDVLIQDKSIAAVGKNISDEDALLYDLSGKIVTPGWIDMHVHLREPGFEGKETIKTGTRAAIAGGVTAVAAMPNTKPVMDNQAVLKYVSEKAKELGWAKVYGIGAISKSSLGEELAEIGELKDAGAVGLSDDGNPVSNGNLMRMAMEYANMFDLPIISHAEDLTLTNEGYMHEGFHSIVLGLRGIPAVSEEAAVARDIQLAEMTKSRLHICHVSTAGSVKLIREAKARGIKVTAEVTPHHLTMTDEAVLSLDTNTKVNPPLRTAKDQGALLEGLKDGTIDAIATDHAPHAPEDKEVEFAYAPFGILGLETFVPLMIDRLIHTGHLSWPEVIKRVTVNPAGILGLELGTLGVGRPADITVIDPEKVQQVDKQRFYSMARNSPFHGWELKGWPIMTIVDGKVLMEAGLLIDQGR